MDKQLGYRTLAERTVGYHEIMGTQHPIIDKVEQFTPVKGRPEWTVTLAICNGVAGATLIYRSKAAALEAYHARGIGISTVPA